MPRASRTGLAGVRDGAILLRVTAPPVDDAANDAVLRFFADLFHVPRSAVTLAAGERSRHKRVRVSGVAAEEAARLLGG